MDTFADWLEQQRQRKAWTVSEFARQAGVQPASLSRVMNGTRQAGPEMCNGIAQALKVPADHVFRAAGLLPPRIIGEDTAEEKSELLDYYDGLARDGRQTLLALARTLYEQRGEYRTIDDTEE